MRTAQWETQRACDSYKVSSSSVLQQEMSFRSMMMNVTLKVKSLKSQNLSISNQVTSSLVFFIMQTNIGFNMSTKLRQITQRERRKVAADEMARNVMKLLSKDIT